jgi:hypothetical protein
MEDPVFKQAKDALDRLSADPEARVRAEQREMWLISYELDRSKTLREGRAEGRLEATLDLVRHQLAAKFGNLPPEALQRLTHASEKDLRKWSERLLFASSLDGVFEGAAPAT